MENFRHFIRQLKVQEEGCKGEPGTVRVSSANKNLFPRNLPPVANRAISNIEMLVVGTTKCIKPFRRPVLSGFGFIYFNSFMVKLVNGN